jgi:hypothetical protein
MLIHVYDFESRVLRLLSEIAAHFAEKLPASSPTHPGYPDAVKHEDHLIGPPASIVDHVSKESAHVQNR